MSKDDHSRVIVHLDIDAFYAQVEENCQPELRTKPLGVYQKTIIVTSNYIAREYGIKKCMLTTEAIKLCPNLVLVNGENLEKYRQISQDITRFIQQKYKVPVEKLGFDENFVDVTKLVEDKLKLENGSGSTRKNMSPKNIESEDNIFSDEDDFSMNPFDTHVHDNTITNKNSSNKRKSEDNLELCEKIYKKAKLTSSENGEKLSALDGHGSKNEAVGHVYNNIEGKCTCGCVNRIIVGTQISNTIRQDIFKEYNLTLSGGISCNKLLSKLVGSLHKPNQQTVIFPNAALNLMSSIHLKQIPGIGSRMIEKLANNLNIKTVEELQNTNRAGLCKTFDSTTADWLLNVSYGRDNSQVKNFNKQSSIGVEDRYAKPITNLNDFIKECKVLLARLLVLIKKDGRIPKLLKIHLRFDHFKFEFKLDSKQCQINSSMFSNPDPKQTETYLMDVIVKLYKELCTKRNSTTITYINIAFGNFIDVVNSENSILKFCQNKPKVSEKTLDSSSEFESPSFSSFSPNNTNSNQNDPFTKKNYDEDIFSPSTPTSCVSGKEKLGFPFKNLSSSNTSNPSTSHRASNASTTIPVNASTTIPVNASTTIPVDQSNFYTNTFDANNIDREVLNELPDDIREEIERELRRNSEAGQSLQKKETVDHKRPVNHKKKAIKQLSMLNFVKKR